MNKFDTMKIKIKDFPKLLMKFFSSVYINPQWMPKGLSELKNIK